MQFFQQQQMLSHLSSENIYNHINLWKVLSVKVKPAIDLFDSLLVAHPVKFHCWIRDLFSSLLLSLFFPFTQRHQNHSIGIKKKKKKKQLNSSPSHPSVSLDMSFSSTFSLTSTSRIVLLLVVTLYSSCYCGKCVIFVVTSPLSFQDVDLWVHDFPKEFHETLSPVYE